MNFTFTWIMDKLGYMPKIDLEIGKLKLDPKEVWPFPVEKEVAKKQDLTKDKDAKDAVKEVKETKDVDTLTFEGLDAVLIFFFLGHFSF